MCGGRFEAFLQCRHIVGDKLGPVWGAGNVDIKGLGRGQVRMVRLHCGNLAIDRALLKRVYGRSPGVVEMTKLGIVAAKLDCLALLETTGDPSVANAGDLGGTVIHELQSGVVVCPTPTTNLSLRLSQRKPSGEGGASVALDF